MSKNQNKVLNNFHDLTKRVPGASYFVEGNLKNPGFFEYIVLAILLLFTFFIRIKSMTAVSIAGDEPFSIFHAQLSIHGIITELAKGNNPPLYELFLHFWTGLFGINPFAVRIPSVIFSVLTALVIFRIGIRFFSLKMAAVSTILFALSNYHTMLAHEARVYSLFGLLAALSMFVFLLLVINFYDRK